MSAPHDTGTSAPEALHCYRHPGRETLVRCTQCDRPICPSCMRQAAVGFRCPECAGGKPTHKAWQGRKLRAPRGTMPATITLVALNALIFLFEVAQSGGFSPTVAATPIIQDGAIFGPLIAEGEWYRLVTGAFLHSSLIHIGFNMLLLWWLGGSLERYVGTSRMLAIYFSAVLWGSAGALLLSADAVTIGASGGVYGLMGAVLVVQRQQGMALLRSFVGVLLILNLVFTFFASNISVGGHLGGLAGGVAAAWVLSGYGKGSIAYGRAGVAGMAGIVGLLAGAVAISLAVV